MMIGNKNPDMWFRRYQNIRSGIFVILALLMAFCSDEGDTESIHEQDKKCWSEYLDDGLETDLELVDCLENAIYQDDVDVCFAESDEQVDGDLLAWCLSTQRWLSYIGR